MHTQRTPILDLPSVATRLPDRPCGKRHRVDRVQGRDQLYRELVRLAIKHKAGTGEFRTTWLQLAAALGYELTGNRKLDDGRYTTVVKRRMKDLRDAGLAAWRPDYHADGRFRCLLVRVLPGELEDEESGRVVDIITGGGHKAAAASGWNRRANGRKKPPRAERTGGRPRPGPIERPIFFGRPEVPSPVTFDPPAPPGPRGVDWDERVRAHEAAAGPMPTEAPRERRQRLGAAVTTLLGCSPEDWQGMSDVEVIAALRDRLASGDLAAADELFALVFDRPAVPARRARRAQLERALRRADRHAPGGRRAGAGAEQLLRLLVRPVDVEPASVAFYAPALDRISKTWRREKRAAATQEVACAA